ncbi:site-2 protease family protein [Aeoliella sp.]|uniref:site-2 protease family protein n=1 Tax=Aeoliella sp. TaxID=2795800 RepID=UPI003CCC2E15
MLGEPAPTQADVHFRIAGFPVRVHPLFWLIALVIGLNSFGGEPIASLLTVGVVFVSILVHELGHAVLQRKYGGWPRIVLWGLGGLAICDDCDRSPRSQILISLAGPVAGFLFAVIVLAILVMTQYTDFVPRWGYADPQTMELQDQKQLSGTWLVIGTLYFQRFNLEALNIIVKMLLWVNIFWGLMNLLPVYPLDGGRIAREVLTLGPRDPQDGIELSLKISFGVAVGMAVVSVIITKDIYLAILFGFLAYNNYRTLQRYTGGPGYGW